MNSPKAVEEGNLTFKRVVNEGEKQTPVTAAISKEDQETLAYFQSLRQAFTGSELLQVLEVSEISELSNLVHRTNRTSNLLIPDLKKFLSIKV